MREIINFSTKFQSLEQINPLITKYQINMCVPDTPAKGYVFSKTVIEGMANTIRGAGVYAYYFENEQQLGGHSDDIVKTKRGFRRTGEPIPYGFSDPYQEPFWTDIDGKIWYSTFVYIWTGRNPEIEDILENEIVYQSMEVAVNDELDGNGNKIVTEAIFLGFCLLQGILPAYSGSKIEKLSLPISTDELNLLKQEYEQFTNENQNQLGLQVENELESVQLSDTQNATIEDNVETNEIDTLNINNQEKEEGEEVIIEAVEKFSLTARQIDEILSNALSAYKYQCGENEYRRYWVRTYDDELVYVCDYEDDKTYSFRYFIVDNVATIDMESRNQVIDGGFISVKPETAQLSEEGGNTEELSAEQLSSNEFVDNAAMQELNENSAEDNKELAEENLENPVEVNTSEEVSMSETEEEIEEPEDKDTVIMSLRQEISDLQEKFSKMESDVNIYIEENTQLKEFKTSIEKQNKEFSIESTLKEVLNILPVEEINNCRLSAEDFSLDNIDIWKNEVKAKAFNFSKGISEKKPFIQVAFPNTDTPKRGKGLWD